MDYANFCEVEVYARRKYKLNGDSCAVDIPVKKIVYNRITSNANIKKSPNSELLTPAAGLTSRTPCFSDLFCSSQAHKFQKAHKNVLCSMFMCVKTRLRRDAGPERPCGGSEGAKLSRIDF